MSAACRGRPAGVKDFERAITSSGSKPSNRTIWARVRRESLARGPCPAYYSLPETPAVAREWLIGEQREQPSRPAGQPPEPASPAFLVMALGRIVREEVETELRAHGLAMRHFSALGHLSHEPGLSYSELGRRAGVTAQSMQATLRQLEELGAVERRTVPGRGRKAQLHVTAVGAELLRRGQGSVRDADERLLADVPAEEREVFTASLLKAFVEAIGRRDASTG